MPALYGVCSKAPLRAGTTVPTQSPMSWTKQHIAARRSFVNISILCSCASSGSEFHCNDDFKAHGFGRTNYHPTPLSFMYRIRRYILGKHSSAFFAVNKSTALPDDQRFVPNGSDHKGSQASLGYVVFVFGAAVALLHGWVFPLSISARTAHRTHVFLPESNLPQLATYVCDRDDAKAELADSASEGIREEASAPGNDVPLSPKILEVLCPINENTRGGGGVAPPPSLMESAPVLISFWDTEVIFLGSGGRGGVVVRLLASQQVEPGLIPGGADPGLRMWES
ncbi:hypothetical protein PR048_012799 [Dryococelus australis]|uniref:Uncharacterized protein n=1 Tax=Dryococelus australis TaxID=614101 RepID=A0ABQ9HQF8_9NEOP|nr:hypothetical protein PR048_012799 [Dryococelus australis]